MSTTTRFNFTEAKLRTVPFPASGRVVYVDLGRKNLILIAGKDSKTYYFRGRLRGGDVVKHKLGRIEDIALHAARTTVSEMSLKAARGEDFRRDHDAKREAWTGADLVHEFLTPRGGRRRTKPRSERTTTEYRRALHADFIPRFGKRGIAEISHGDLTRLVTEVSQRARKRRGKGVAGNRLMAVVKAMFAFAVDEGQLVDSPARRLRMPAAEQSRERVLGGEELRSLLLACHDGRLGRNVADVVLLLLLTAQRRSEVVGMRWNGIDLEAGTWTLTAAETKNGVANVLALPDWAMSILRRRWSAREPGATFVFPGSGAGQFRSLKPDSVTRAISRIQGDVSDRYTVHDLRRTAATNLAQILGPSSLVGRILNHGGSASNVTARYDRYAYLQEMRDALSAWALRLERMHASLTTLSSPPEAHELANAA